MQRVAAIVLCGLFGLVGSRASAQSFDLAGTRAKGMAGAFVAVADDDAATWWIPAGISNTLIFDGVADFRRIAPAPQCAGMAGRTGTGPHHRGSARYE